MFRGIAFLGRLAWNVYSTWGSDADRAKPAESPTGEAPLALTGQVAVDTYVEEESNPGDADATAIHTEVLPDGSHGVAPPPNTWAREVFDADQADAVLDEYERRASAKARGDKPRSPHH